MSEASDRGVSVLSIDTIHTQLSYIEGEVLTHVDAAFQDIEQRNAYKSLMRTLFKNRHRWFDELAYGANYSGAIGSSNGELSLPEKTKS